LLDDQRICSIENLFVGPDMTQRYRSASVDFLEKARKLISTLGTPPAPEIKITNKTEGGQDSMKPEPPESSQTREGVRNYAEVSRGEGGAGGKLLGAEKSENASHPPGEGVEEVGGEAKKLRVDVGFSEKLLGAEGSEGFSHPPKEGVKEGEKAEKLGGDVGLDENARNTLDDARNTLENTVVDGGGVGENARFTPEMIAAEAARQKAEETAKYGERGWGESTRQIDVKGSIVKKGEGGPGVGGEKSEDPV
jgi:hypothetical protein